MPIRRRVLLGLLPATALGLPRRGRAAPAAAENFARVPIEIAGTWPGAPVQAVLRVLTRARQACLEGVALLSDRQPDRLRVENHPSGPPHIWLHFDNSTVGWIVVDIGPRDWCKLSYQFGHELGHVLCNSWGPDARPRNPCQWLEEALVESFSIHGLGRLAVGWAADPPFAGDASFAGPIVKYRNDLVQHYRELAASAGASRGLAAWFAAQRASLESNGGISGPAGGAVPAVVEEMEAHPEGIEGLGALNRWPERTGVPLEEYLRRWKRSCAELGASQRMPIRLRAMLLGQ
jgi:hypothetical protein